MLNRQQREFRKQMKRIKQDNSKVGLDEPLSYRDQNYRPRKYRRPLFLGGGGAAVLIILWNVFAISTWIHTRNATSSYLTTSTASSSQPGIAVAMDEQKKVSDYIQTSKNIDQQLVTLTTGYLNPNKLSSISASQFGSTNATIDSMEQMAMTNLRVLEPLKIYEVKQIQIMDSVLQNVQLYQKHHNSSEWQMVQQLISQYNLNQTTKQSIIVSILDAEHMSYQIGANGEIEYQYH